MTMVGYSFTHNAVRALHHAREAAFTLGHNYVGTEHALLGVLREPRTPAIASLLSLRVDLDALEASVLAAIPQGTAEPDNADDIPYTSRCKKAMEEAMAEAAQYRSTSVGAEHLLLGLLREKHGIAAQQLLRVGVTLDAVRAIAHAPVELLPDGTLIGATSSLTSILLWLEFANGTKRSVSFERTEDAITFLQGRQ